MKQNSREGKEEREREREKWCTTRKRQIVEIDMKGIEK